MSQITMSADEREAFLADLHVGVVAVERPDGPPLAVPVWYRYSPGGAVEFVTESSSVKGRLLEQGGRAALCAQQEALPYAYVSVEGPVEIVASTPDDLLDLAVRYLGESAGAAYAAQSQGGDGILVRIHPERWFSADYAKLQR